MNSTTSDRTVTLTAQQIASLRDLVDIKTETLFQKQLAAHGVDAERVKLYAATIAYWDSIDRVLRNS